MSEPRLGATMVTLIDGRLVFSDAEEWRAECEARAVLKMPLDARREYLWDIERMRGPDAAEKLRETMTQLHAARKAVA